MRRREPQVWRIALLASACIALAGAAAHPQKQQLATGRITIAPWQYLPGSLLQLHVNGFAPPYQFAVLGAGRIAGGFYEVPRLRASSSALLVVGNAAGLAAATVRIGIPPPKNRALLVAASYDDGLVFHDAHTLSVLGVLAIPGAPGDVAIDADGRVAAPDTQGTSLALARLQPWGVVRIGDVAFGDDVAIDGRTRQVFVTDRDWNGSGALTRIDAGGAVTRVATGATAEGLAIDERRQLVYVANTNDGTVAVINARSMRVVRRFYAIGRAFSLVLSPDGTRLYVVSNQSAESLFAAAGSAVAFALRGPRSRLVARSADLTFPLGAALDSSTQTLFVTDEALARIDVLDARSLRPKRPPLQTCATPWKPALDASAHRLYVPCAGANTIDAFDLRTLRRIAGAPFATGGYPLAIAIWRPSERSE